MAYTENVGSSDWKNNPYESQAKLFSSFLFKSSRYVTDQIFSAVADIRQKKNLFLKDIQYFAFKDIRGFQQLLSNFMKYSEFSMVFSLSNSPNLSNELNSTKIFKSDFRKELGLDCVILFFLILLIHLFTNRSYFSLSFSLSALNYFFRVIRMTKKRNLLKFDIGKRFEI